MRAAREDRVCFSDVILQGLYTAARRLKCRGLGGVGVLELAR